MHSINIGSRQANRLSPASVVDALPSKTEILAAVNNTWELPAPAKTSIRGVGKAAKDFLTVLSRRAFWDVPLDKSVSISQTEAASRNGPGRRSHSLCRAGDSRQTQALRSPL